STMQSRITYQKWVSKLVVLLLALSAFGGYPVQSAKAISGWAAWGEGVGLSFSSINANSVTMNWPSVTEATYGTIDKYNVYNGASLIGSSTTSTFTASGLSPNTSYDFKVTAVTNTLGESLPISTTVQTAQLIGTNSIFEDWPNGAAIS